MSSEQERSPLKELQDCCNSNPQMSASIIDATNRLVKSPSPETIENLALDRANSYGGLNNETIAQPPNDLLLNQWTYTIPAHQGYILCVGPEGNRSGPYYPFSRPSIYQSNNPFPAMNNIQFQNFPLFPSPNFSSAFTINPLALLNQSPSANTIPLPSNNLITSHTPAVPNIIYLRNNSSNNDSGIGSLVSNDSLVSSPRINESGMNIDSFAVPSLSRFCVIKMFF